MDNAAVAVPGVRQVDEHVGLRVEPRRGAHQVLEVDPVRPAAEPQLDALVFVAFAKDPVADSGLHQIPGHVGLKDAGPVRGLDLVPGAGVEDEGLHAGEPEQVGQHQAGRSGADHRDGDLGGGVDSGVGRGVGHGVS